jgi:hypothetical protein
VSTSTACWKILNKNGRAKKGMKDEGGGMKAGKS